MKTIILFTIACLFFLSCTRTVYIVRHAEKAQASDSLPNMSLTDPPLSEPGKVRAMSLKNELAGKHISHIYSTNTIRTFYTADPLSKSLNIPTKVYSNIDSLVTVLKNSKGNSLVVGHSNTVDDIANKLAGKIYVNGDLKDNEYDNLFIVRFRGKKASFERRKYGYPSNP